MKPLHVALVALLVVAGCKSSGKPKVAFVSNNSHSFWSIAKAGAEKAEAEFDVQLFFHMPGDTDIALQKEKIDQVMNQGIKAIAISVISPEKQGKYLTSLSKKVSLLTQDNDAPDSGRLAYIGTDNYEAGKAAGALVKQAMPKGGKVVIFVGDLAALNAQQRRQGVIDELAGKKTELTQEKLRETGIDVGNGYVVWKTMTDSDSSTKPRENAVQALTQLKDEADLCLVGLWAYNPPAILSAVKSAGRVGKVHIVGFDEDAKTLDAVKAGEIHGTIVQQPFEFGYQSVKLMSKLARGDKSALPEGGMLVIPHLAITKDGKGLAAFDGKKTEGRPADEFQTQLNKMLGK